MTYIDVHIGKTYMKKYISNSLFLSRGIVEIFITYSVLKNELMLILLEKLIYIPSYKCLGVEHRPEI